MSAVTRIRTKASITIGSPPDAVWAVIVDFEAYGDWWPPGFVLNVTPSPRAPLGTEIEVQPRLARTFFLRVEEADAARSMRIRFFGGALEGPAYLVVEPSGKGTRVACEVDVFARGLPMAALSLVLPLKTMHALHLRRVLQGLQRQVGKRAQPAPLDELRRVGARAAEWLRDGIGRVVETASAVAPVPASVPATLSQLDLARAYLRVLSAAGDSGEIARCFHQDATEEEFPNADLPAGAVRDLAAILYARSQAHSRWRQQSFEVRGATAGGSQVAIEVHWTAIPASTPAGSAPGPVLARAAMFLKMQDQLIVRQRTYMSFAPAAPADPSPMSDASESTHPDPPEPPPLESVPPRSNFEIARSYLQALSSGASPSEVARFFAEDAIQEELPGPFNPQGASRDVAGIRLAREQTLAGFSSEQHDLRGAIGSGAKVAMEVHRTYVAGANHPSLAEGERQETRSAVFLKFRGGLIVRQRSYDCFVRTGGIS